MANPERQQVHDDRARGDHDECGRREPREHDPRQSSGQFTCSFQSALAVGVDEGRHDQ